MPRVLVIAASPLLQGRALESLLALLSQLVSLDAPGLSFDELYSQIEAKVTYLTHAHAAHTQTH